MQAGGQEDVKSLCCCNTLTHVDGHNTPQHPDTHGEARHIHSYTTPAAGLAVSISPLSLLTFVVIVLLCPQTTDQPCEPHT